MTRRVVHASAVLLAAAGLAGLVLLDASRQEHTRATEHARAVVRTVGLPDLALSSTSRWLRHPSQVEPWAAVSDHPAALDTEPAGSVIGPPLP